jgi:SAP domain
MDYGKMKVIELRAELQARGLDTKGDLFDFASVKKFSLNFQNFRRESGSHRPIKGSNGLGGAASR